MPKRMTIAEQLRRAVNASDQTGSDLAAAAGLNESTLSRFRRGIGNPQLAAAESLARVVGYSLELVPLKTRKRSRRKR
ncbi:MAG: helix-turn-helix transcriptional regulator [Planctomycetes bacterium]|nr:helix-turn-helix transcriptional regulator [Planctomycetota bacterium]